PASDETERGLAARIDRLASRLQYGGVPEASAQQPAADDTPQADEAGLSGVATARAALSRPPQSAEQQDQSDLQPAAQASTEQGEPSPQPGPTPEAATEIPQHSTAVQEAAAQEAPQQTQPQAAASQDASEQPAQQQAPAEPQPSQVEMVRRAWPEVLEFLKSQSRLIWMTINGKDRKSTRLNSSHVSISYAVFCLKKKT